MRSLDGKVAVVTGASKGIGRGLAVGLATYGAAIVVSYKSDREGAEATGRAIREAGGTVELVQANVGIRHEAEMMVRTACERLGRVDVLINNAGRTRFGAAPDVSDDDWEDVVGTNLRGPFFASIAAFEQMRAQGEGSIINITSCAATLMIKDHSIYTMSKGGLEALTRQLALEFAPTVRVNAIAPAPTSTERNRDYDADYDANWGRVIPLGRVAFPSDYVGPAAFLGSAESAFMTGQVLHVDGGWTLKGHTPDMTDYEYVADRQRG
jgi:NAD(P)-dependent dehydrogenase (short-subunit alcohol dehydrogenase family)